jgi:hypothetical protein
LCIYKKLMCIAHYRKLNKFKKTGSEARKKTVLAVKIILRKLHTRRSRTAENGSRNVLLPFTADQPSSSMQDFSARLAKKFDEQ